MTVGLDYVLGAAALIGALGVVCARDTARSAVALWIMAASLAGVFVRSGEVRAATVYFFLYSGASVLLFLAALALERGSVTGSWRRTPRAWLAAAVAAAAGLGLATVITRNVIEPSVAAAALGNPFLALAICSCLAAAAAIAVVAITEPPIEAPVSTDGTEPPIEAPASTDGTEPPVSAPASTDGTESPPSRDVEDR